MTFSVAYLNTLFLINIRLGMILLFTPIRAIQQLPILVRFSLLTAISLLLLPHVPLTTFTSESKLVLGGLAEAFNGLILGLSIQAAFAVFQLAGQFIDNQIGLNSISIFNPADHAEIPLSGHLLSLLGVLVFFSCNSHHQLILGLLHSFKTIPPGEWSLLQGFAPLINQFSQLFIFALILAGPVVIGLLIIDCCFAILSRNLPQVNTYFLSIPIKILLGWYLLSLTLDGIQNPIIGIFQQCFITWGELFL